MTDRSITVIVPGAPQGKGRAKIVKIGGFSRMATPAKTVAYEGLIALAAQQVMAKHGVSMIAGPATCHITAVCPIPASWSNAKRRRAVAGQERPTTKPDADNIVKAVFDGLNGVLWKDDVQCTELSMRKQYGEQPAVYATVMWRDGE